MRAFGFIEAEKANFPVSFMCRRLHVSRSGDHAWPAGHRVPGTGLTPSWSRSSGQSTAAGVVGSMGSVGDCFDNALAESFFATLQTDYWTATPGQPATSSGWRSSAGVSGLGTLGERAARAHVARGTE